MLTVSSDFIYRTIDITDSGRYIEEDEAIAFANKMVCSSVWKLFGTSRTSGDTVSVMYEMIGDQCLP